MTDFLKSKFNKIITMEGLMYILLCSDWSYYTGSTIDLKRRLEEHKNGEGANHTKKDSLWNGFILKNLKE
jgi:predicted GIY-YIG superfamily endonuclease